MSEKPLAGLPNQRNLKTLRAQTNGGVSGFYGIVVALIVCSLVLTLWIRRDVEPSFVKIGAHPVAGSSPFKTIHTLKEFQGKIYMGYGNWDHHPGPLVITSFDPARGAFQLEHSAGTDSIGHYREIDGKLYCPSIDPVHDAEFVDFLVKDERGWKSHTPLGMLHLFDLASFRGDLWLVGSKTSNETPTDGGAVFRCLDRDHKEWIDQTPEDNPFRYWWIFELNDRLYVDNLFFDGESWHPSSFGSNNGGNWSRIHKPIKASENGRELIFCKAYPDLDSPSDESALVSFDGVATATLLSSIRDFALNEVGDVVYVLTGNNRILKGKFPIRKDEDWSDLGLGGEARFTALEYFNGQLYLGDSEANLWVGNADGSEASVSETTVENRLPDGLGWSMAAHEDTLITTSPHDVGEGNLWQAGSVLVWKEGADGAGLTLQSKLTSPDPKQKGFFGHAVATNGHFIAILERGGGHHQGRKSLVHLYHLRENAWVLFASIDVAFGQALAIAGETLFVAQESAISVYAIKTNELDPEGYFVIKTQSLEIEEGGKQYSPFTTLSAQGNLLIAGTSGDISRAGGPGAMAVYALREGVWRSVQHVANNNPNRFGFSTAISGDTLAVGAPRHDEIKGNEGIVILYRRKHADSGKITFERSGVVQSPQREANGFFGQSLAMRNDSLIVGAPGENLGEGRAYWFRENERGEWILKEVIGHPDWSKGGFGSEVIFYRGAGVIASELSIDGLTPLERLSFLPTEP